MSVQKLKSKFPTAKQIADGIEFESPLKSLPGWTIFVKFELMADPKDDDEWIDDFVWKAKKPAKGKTKRRFIVLGTQQLGLDKLQRLPADAQEELQKYTHACWQKKIDATSAEMERRWEKEDRETPEGDDLPECGS
jgi:hypothetical protein